MNRAAASTTMLRPRLAWRLWALGVVSVAPVCAAQDFRGLALLAGGGGALGEWRTMRRGRPVLGQRLATLTAAVLAAVVAAMSVDAGTIGIFAVANWLIAVGVLKCWQLGGSRDAAHVLIVSGLLLLVGSLISGQLGYAVCLALALLLAPAALIGWHLQSERERVSRLGGVNGGTTVAPAGRLYGMSLAGSVVCAVTGFLIFATFPRLRTPLQPAIRAGGRAVTGFSTEARLNDIGRLQVSERVAMRVRLRVEDQPLGGPDLQPYFRGLTYNHYNGRTWENRGPAGEETLVLPEDASLTHFRRLGRADLPAAIEQEYWVDSPPRKLFAIPSAVAVGSEEIARVEWRRVDDVLSPSDRLAAAHYKVLSVPPHVLAAAQQAAASQEGEPAAVPARPPRIYTPIVSPAVVRQAAALADEVRLSREDPARPEALVNRFVRYLQEEFIYSLEPPPGARGYNALDQFLRHRHGYCEYFATTLAVFCQLSGVPARYVAGYRGGKYNEVGQFYAVRDSDAHSWVEVWLPDRGWTQVDPTPAERGGSTRSSLRQQLASLLDYLEFQWSSWVVAYDVLHRQDLLGTFGDWMEPPAAQHERPWTQFLWMFQQLLIGPETLSPLGKILYWLGLLIVLALSGYLAVQLGQQLSHWWRRRRQRRAAQRVGVRFYERITAALEQRELVREPAETPREFARRAEQALPAVRGCLAELIEQYYAVRHGQVDRVAAGERLAGEILGRLQPRQAGKDNRFEQTKI